MTPPANSALIEVSEINPYSTIGIDGGMIGPMMADVVLTAAEKPGE